MGLLQIAIILIALICISLLAGDFVAQGDCRQGITRGARWVVLLTLVACLFNLAPASADACGYEAEELYQIKTIGIK